MKNKIKKSLIISALSSLSLISIVPVIVSCSNNEKNEDQTKKDIKKIYELINNSEKEVSNIISLSFISLYNSLYLSKNVNDELTEKESKQLISQLGVLFDPILEYDLSKITIFVFEKTNSLSSDKLDEFQDVKIGLKYNEDKYNISFKIKLNNNSSIDRQQYINELSELFTDKQVWAGEAQVFSKSYNNLYNKLGANKTLTTESKNQLLNSYKTFYNWENSIDLFEGIEIYVLENTVPIETNIGEERDFNLTIGLRYIDNKDIKKEKIFILTILPEQAIETKVAFFEGPSIVNTKTGVRGIIAKDASYNNSRTLSQIDPNILPKSKEEAINKNSQYWLDVSTWKLTLKDETNNLTANIEFKPRTVKMATIDTSQSDEVKTNVSITINNFLGLGTIKINDIYFNNQVVDQTTIYNEDDPDSNNSQNDVVLAGYKLNEEGEIVPNSRKINIAGLNLSDTKNEEIEYSINPSSESSEDDRIKNFLYLQQYYFNGEKFDSNNIYENKKIIIPKGIYQSGSKSIDIEKPTLQIGSKNIDIIMQPGVIFTSKGKTGAENNQQTIMFTKDAENIRVFGGSYYGKTGGVRKSITIKGNNIEFHNGYFDGRSYENKDESTLINETFYVDGDNGINKFKVYNSYITNGIITFANGVGKKDDSLSQEKDILFQKNTILYSPVRLNGRDINIAWRSKDIYVKPYFEQNLFALYNDPFSTKNKFYYLSYSKETGSEDNFDIDDYFDKGMNTFADPEPWIIEDKLRPALSDQTILKIQRNTTTSDENINNLYKIVDVIQFKNTDNDEELSFNVNGNYSTVQWAGFIDGARSNNDSWGTETNLEFYNDEQATEKFDGNIKDLANGDTKYARFKKYAQVVYFW